MMFENGVLKIWCSYTCMGVFMN